jgi:hypothetical protein
MEDTATLELLRTIQDTQTQAIDATIVACDATQATQEPIASTTTTTTTECSESRNLNERGDVNDDSVYQQPVSIQNMRNMFLIDTPVPLYSVDLSGCCSSTTTSSSTLSSLLSASSPFLVSSTNSVVKCHCPIYLLTCPQHQCVVEQYITKHGANAGIPYHACRRFGECHSYTFRFDKCSPTNPENQMASIAAGPPSSTDSTLTTSTSPNLGQNPSTTVPNVVGRVAGCTCNQVQMCPSGHGVMLRSISKSRANPGTSLIAHSSCKKKKEDTKMYTCKCYVFFLK